MNIESHWKAIRRIFKQASDSSFHFAMATVTPEGLPHVTPIGSLILTKPGLAIYFEEFPTHLPRNLDTNPNVCVLAVRSGLLFWLFAILRGHFNSPPAIRLHGTAGTLRTATGPEIALWQKHVCHVRGAKGHRIMWANMRTVRDIQFTKFDGVHIGEMTALSWKRFAAQ